MKEPGPKITIAPDELPQAPMPTPGSDDPPERLVLLPIPIPDSSVSERASLAQPVDGEYTPPSFLRLVLITLIPFANAWYWARQARRMPAVSRVSWAMALFLGCASLAFTILIGFMFLGQGGDRSERAREDSSISERSNWLERLAEMQDRSVVVVHSAAGSGTAFVVATKENRQLFLTNRHVLARKSRRLREVQLATPCMLQLRDGSEYPAKVVGLPKQEELDLALLEAQIPDMVPLGRVAEFAEVRQGERVAVIGHPLGLDFTIADGIVSAKRDERYIQTTAPINPGNSGGPLVNSEGKIIGVCTLLLDARGGQGVGMALRADFVLNPRSWRLLDADVENLQSSVPR